jgi:uncharacterized protein (DUF58 family)
VIVPTRLTLGLLALGLAIPVLGAFAPGAELLVIAWDALVLGAMLASGLASRRLPPVEVRRRTDQALSSGAENTASLIVENRTGARQEVRLRETPPAGCRIEPEEFRVVLRPGEEKRLRYTLSARQRGRGEMPATALRWKDPLGLAWVQADGGNAQAIDIYPNVKALADYELLKQKGRLSQAGIRRSRIKGLGQDFESLRDYNDDDYRLIDWKASARRGRLVVKNLEQEKNQAVVVCLDIGRHMLGDLEDRTKLDFALDAGLMLMHAAERNGDHVGLLVYSDLVHRWTAPRGGRAQVAAVLDAMHDLEAEPVETDHARAFAYAASRWKRRSLFVLFTDVEDEEQARALASALAGLGRRHLVMTVRVTDPRLKELQALPVRTTREMHQRAAALWYFQDRARARRVLDGARIDSIEAEPNELSAALVSAYLRVKDLNLI